MKRYQLLIMVFIFSGFASAAFAQTKQKEPVLYPIKKETLKAYDDANKDFEPAKASSSDATKAKEPEKKEKPEKPVKEPPVKPEKEKREKAPAEKTRKAGEPQ